MTELEALTAAALPSPAAKELERKVFWRVVPQLFAVALISQIDRSNLAYAALQLDGDLGFSATVHGLGSGLFFIGYLAQFPAGIACLALGVRRWLTLIITAWSVVAALFAAIENEAQFLVLRFFLGLAEAGTYPAIYAQLTHFFDPDGLGLAYTWVATATAVAGVVGAPLAALFLSLNGLGGLRGWRWLFIFEALPAALLAVVTWVYTPSPLDTTWLSSAERAALAALTRPRAEHGPSVQLAEVSGSPKGAALAEEGALSADDVPLLSPSKQLSQESVDLERPSAAPAAPADPEAPSAVKSAFRHVVRDPRLWYLGIIMMLIDWSMNSINLWLPQILMASLKSEASDSDSDTESTDAASSERLRATISAALLSGIPFGVAGLAMLANAWSSRRTRERRWHTALPMLVAALAFAALAPAAKVAGPAGAVLALTLAAAGVWAPHGPFFSWPSAILEPRHASLGFALIKTLGAIGGFAGPLLVGMLADAGGGSFTAGTVVLAGVAALAALLTAVFRQ